jgi:hypothetical protein
VKEIREHLEDEDVLQVSESVIFNTMRLVLRWLGLSIQCPGALIKLTNRLKPKHTICFRPIIVPKTAAQKRQASLDAIVKAVVGYPSFEPAKQNSKPSLCKPSGTTFSPLTGMISVTVLMGRFIAKVPSRP